MILFFTAMNTNSSKSVDNYMDTRGVLSRAAASNSATLAPVDFMVVSYTGDRESLRACRRRSGWPTPGTKPNFGAGT